MKKQENQDESRNSLKGLEKKSLNIDIDTHKEIKLWAVAAGLEMYEVIALAWRAFVSQEKTGLERQGANAGEKLHDTVLKFQPIEGADLVALISKFKEASGEAYRASQEFLDAAAHGVVNDASIFVTDAEGDAEIAERNDAATDSLNRVSEEVDPRAKDGAGGADGTLGTPGIGGLRRKNSA